MAASRCEYATTIEIRIPGLKVITNTVRKAGIIVQSNRIQFKSTEIVIKCDQYKT